MSYWFAITFGKLSRKIFPQFKVNELRIFPIKKITESAQQPFIKLVETIIEKKKAGLDTTKEEAEIDTMVYKLYELTEEEIKVVEGKI